MAYSKGPNYDEYVDVWTDGFCSENGPYANYGGIGVFWGENHPWNVSQRTNGITNNSCEIEAAICAIKTAKFNGVSKLRINTDSKFLINCVMKRMPTWRENGWLTPTGKFVKNIRELMELNYELDGSIRVRWNHIPTSSGYYENSQADKFAKLGARN